MLRDSKIGKHHGFKGMRIALFTLALITMASTHALADPDDAAQLLRKRHRRGGVTVMPDRRTPAQGLRNTAPQGGIIPITPPMPRGGNPPHIPPQFSGADEAERTWNPVASLVNFLRGLRSWESR
jgi:hypothetical protein